MVTRGDNFPSPGFETLYSKAEYTVTNSRLVYEPRRMVGNLGNGPVMLDALPLTSLQAKEVYMRCSPSFALRITYHAEDCDIKGCGDFDPFAKAALVVQKP